MTEAFVQHKIACSNTGAPPVVNTHPRSWVVAHAKGLTHSSPSQTGAVRQSFVASGITLVSTVLCVRQRRRCSSRVCGLTSSRMSNKDQQDGIVATDVAQIKVAVRNAARSIDMKRFTGKVSDKVGVNGLPALTPAVLVVHDSPGRSSRYLEPLAAQLCMRPGRSCYLYDQLGNGLPNHQMLRMCVRDLGEILRCLSEQLGEPEVHLVGHGFGGMVVMEALLRTGLWDSNPQDLPRLRSVCLVSTPSSTSIMKTEAWRLMNKAKANVGKEKAVAKFWYKHYCGLQSPTCLAEAYATADEIHMGGWEPWDHCIIRGWQIRREEVQERYALATGGAPLLCVRGSNDFVTEACMEAWRGAKDSLASPKLPTHVSARVQSSRDGNFLTFREEALSGCGHNSHLEDSVKFGALVQDWLQGVEVYNRLHW